MTMCKWLELLNEMLQEEHSEKSINIREKHY